jgi:hypothetical protein
MDRDLRIYAKGTAFADGIYDLRVLEVLVGNYRKIFDQLVTIQVGKRRPDRKLKAQLGYQVQVNPGSLELLVKFVLDHPEVLGALAADGGYALAEQITKLLKNAITLREKAAEVIKKGLAINISIINSFNVASRIHDTDVSFDSNKGTIVIGDPKILWAAQMTRGPVNEILRQIDGHDVEFIDLNTRSQTYRLTTEQRQIIGRQKEVLPTTLSVIGRLDMVSFSAHRGTIISDSQRYGVTWDEQIRSKIQKVVDVEDVVFRVKPVVDHKRLDNDAIGFHVLDCDVANISLDL